MPGRSERPGHRRQTLARRFWLPRSLRLRPTSRCHKASTLRFSWTRGTTLNCSPGPAALRIVCEAQAPPCGLATDGERCRPKRKSRRDKPPCNACAFRKAPADCSATPSNNPGSGSACIFPACHGSDPAHATTPSRRLAHKRGTLPEPASFARSDPPGWPGPVLWRQGLSYDEVLLRLMVALHSSEREPRTHPRQQPLHPNIEREVQLSCSRNSLTRLPVLARLKMPIGPTAVDRAKLF